MLALWRWWMGHKLRDRIAVLEAASASPQLPPSSSTVQINLAPGATYQEIKGGENRFFINGEMEIDSPIPINVKSTQLETHLRAEGGGSASLSVKDQWLASPGAGRLAAKLIMRALTLQDARDIWSAFYSTKPRTDTHVAGWAFSWRLEDAGHGQEVYDLAFNLAESDADMTMVDDEMQAEIKSWRGEG